MAVDPLDGTTIVSKGLTGAIAVLAVAPKGCLLHAPDMYMDKIAVGPKAVGKISLDAPVEDNIKAVASALDKQVEDVTVVILDRPRHEDIIKRARKTGARIQLISDGDLAPAVAVALENPGWIWCSALAERQRGLLPLPRCAAWRGDAGPALARWMKRMWSGLKRWASKTISVC